MLNKFMVGLVRAALAVKTQRAEAEERQRRLREEERKRAEERKRLAEAELRWREEQGRVEQLERLSAMWERSQRLAGVVHELKNAIGEVEADSELGKWLSWAEDHVDAADPLRHIRARTRGTLTLYYYGYDRRSVEEHGFSESTTLSYGQETPATGVELTCRPPRLTAYETAFKLEIEEEVVLAYEWAQESDWHCRVFRVPAALLNRLLGYASPSEPSA
jgi:hypothetical protein